MDTRRDERELISFEVVEGSLAPVLRCTRCGRDIGYLPARGHDGIPLLSMVDDGHRHWRDKHGNDG